jgi:hypothetical protein
MRLEEEQWGGEELMGVECEGGEGRMGCGLSDTEMWMEVERAGKECKMGMRVERCVRRCEGGVQALQQELEEIGRIVEEVGGMGYGDMGYEGGMGYVRGDPESEREMWEDWMRMKRENGWGDDKRLQLQGSDGVWRDMVMGQDGWLVPVMLQQYEREQAQEAEEGWGSVSEEEQEAEQGWDSVSEYENELVEGREEYGGGASWSDDWDGLVEECSDSGTSEEYHSCSDGGSGSESGSGDDGEAATQEGSRIMRCGMRMC